MRLATARSRRPDIPKRNRKKKATLHDTTHTLERKHTAPQHTDRPKLDNNININQTCQQTFQDQQPWRPATGAGACNFLTMKQ